MAKVGAETWICQLVLKYWGMEQDVQNYVYYHSGRSFYEVNAKWFDQIRLMDLLTRVKFVQFPCKMLPKHVHGLNTYNSRTLIPMHKNDLEIQYVMQRGEDKSWIFNKGQILKRNERPLLSILTDAQKSSILRPTLSRKYRAGSHDGESVGQITWKPFQDNGGSITLQQQ